MPLWLKCDAVKMHGEKSYGDQEGGFRYFTQ